MEKELILGLMEADIVDHLITINQTVMENILTLKIGKHGLEDFIQKELYN